MYQISRIDNAVTMTSKEIASLTGKDLSHIHRDTRVMLDELEGADDPDLDHVREDKDARGYTACFHLPKGLTFTLMAGYSVKMRHAIIKRWQELEAKTAPAIPNFNNPAEAARAWAEAYEAKQIAEATKAQIGHKREATAMNTASQAVKKAKKLEQELDRSKEYASVKRMEMLYHGTPFNWRLLKSAAADLGIPSIDVFDANYGTVKAYHAEVWKEAYALDISSDAVAI